jgi:hypothetical protein
MSTATICYPNTIRERPASNPGLYFILITFVLIASIVLVIVVSANAVLTARAPVPQGSVTAIPVPTPPTAENGPTAIGTPAPSSGPTNDRLVVAIPVPTP